MKPRPVLVAMQLERGNAPERWLNRLRENWGVRVLQVGHDPGSVLALLAALARNEIVPMQGNCASGDHVVEVELFGAPVRFAHAEDRHAAIIARQAREGSAAAVIFGPGL